MSKTLNGFGVAFYITGNEDPEEVSHEELLALRAFGYAFFDHIVRVPFDRLYHQQDLAGTLTRELERGSVKAFDEAIEKIARLAALEELKPQVARQSAALDHFEQAIKRFQDVIAAFEEPWYIRMWKGFRVR